MANLKVGGTVGSYRVEQVLGSGGFGVTYLVRDEQLDKLFALKEYFPEEFALRQRGNTVRARSNRSDDFQWGKERFLDEARILARFNHPNIVDVVRIFEANGTAYILEGYQSGRSLKEWLTSLDGPPTQEELDLLLLPILAALEIIHGNGLLHRDIAPDNIYIRDDGSPVLLDFGSAREAVAQRTKTVSSVVKAGYSPPEQYSTKGKAQGPWSDIYALAATLYLSVTGAAPEESSERIMADDMVPLVNSARGSYRRTFLEAVDWALAVTPSGRPQSIEDWRRSLLLTDETKASSAHVARSSSQSRQSSHRQASFDTRRPGSKSLQKTYRLELVVLVCVALALAAFGYIKYSSQISTIGPQQASNLPQQKPASNLAGLSSSYICAIALDVSREAWDVRGAYAAYRLESQQNRNLSVADCRAAIGLPREVQQVSKPKTELKNLSNEKLCNMALTIAKDRWDLPAFREAADEAGSRNFTVADCRVAIGLPGEVLAAQDVSRDALKESSHNGELCWKALNGSRNGWKSTPDYQDEVHEAQLKHLSIPDCRAAIGLPREVQQVSKPKTELKNLSNEKLCNMALTIAKDRWDLPAFREAADEAGSRNFTVADCRVAIGLPGEVLAAQDVSRDALKESSHNGELCWKALNGSRNGWKSTPDYQDEVHEAQLKHLSIPDCRAAIGLPREVQQVSKPKTELKNLSNEKLCNMALTIAKDRWDLPAFREAADEAGSRNFTVADCRVAIGLPGEVLAAQDVSRDALKESSHNGELCWKALNGSRNGWKSTPDYQDEVHEAQLKHLSIPDCRAAIGLPREVQQVSKPKTELKNLSNEKLCNMALTIAKDRWDLPAFREAADEAGSRNFTVADCRVAIGLPGEVLAAQDVSRDALKESSHNGELCWKALNGSRNGWKSTPDYQDEVHEAQLKHLSIPDCRAAIGLPRDLQPSPGDRKASIQFSGLANSVLCRMALSSKKTGWETDTPYYQEAIDEALLRQLSVDDCRKELGVGIMSNEIQNKFASYSDQFLCSMVLNPKHDNWDESGLVDREVQVAKARKLTIHECRQALGYGLQSQTNIENVRVTELPNRRLCQKVLSENHLSWKTDLSTYDLVKEAQSRGLTTLSCRQLVETAAPDGTMKQTHVAKPFPNLKNPIRNKPTSRPVPPNTSGDKGNQKGCVVFDGTTFCK